MKIVQFRTIVLSKMILILSFLFTPMDLALARWARSEEADASIESHKISIEVHKNFGHLMVEELEIKVLRDSARDRFGTLRINYLPGNTKLRVEEAYSKNGDHVERVSSSDISDTPISSSEAGYDQMRQVVVPFKSVEVGTVLHYKTVERVRRPLVPDTFSIRLWPGWENIDRQFEISIQSEIPIFFNWTDPLKVVKALPDSDSSGLLGSGRKLHFKLEKPVYHSLVNELKAGSIWDLITSIQLSSDKMSNSAFGKLAQKFEDRLKDPLPSEFRPEQLGIQKEELSTKQLNEVLAKLADRLRYMGDWRAIEGAIVPRTLAEIARTHYGDCKDLSVLATKVFRELGYRAYVALVWRGVPPPPKRENSSLEDFNHAIVYVELNGRDYWLDPTNPQVFADGVFEDILERESVILKSGGPERKWIASRPAAESIYSWKIAANLLKSGTMTKEGKLQMTGFHALSLAGQELKYSRAQIEDFITEALASPDDRIESSVTSSDLRARVVGPITVEAKVKSKYTPRRTSMGPAVLWTNIPLVNDFEKIDLRERVSPLRLGVPQVGIDVTRFENVKMLGHELRPCRALSPWLDYESSILQKGRAVEGRSRIEIKQYMVSPNEVRSPEFSRFVKKLRECGSDQMMIYRHQ